MWDFALDCASLCSTTVYSYSPATRGTDEDLVAIQSSRQTKTYYQSSRPLN